jgi:molecular chaperone GrpE
MSDEKFTANSSQPIDDQEVQDDSVQPEVVEETSTKPAEENIDYKDKWLRAQADYSNLVKETNARRAEWVAYSEAQILEEFLPVYDNFCKAFAHEIKNGEKDFESWKKGIGYIMQQFWTVLKNHNIEKIETIGKQFDPNIHEAVGQESVEGKQEGEIVREVDPGYSMKGRVIKVAKVITNSLS